MLTLVHSQIAVANLTSYFPPLAPLLEDDAVTEIMVVSGKHGVLVFYERLGQLHETDYGKQSLRDVEGLIMAITRPLGKNANKMPLVDARLADGSRVALCVQPATPYPCVTIRRFSKTEFTAQDLVRMGSLPQPVLDVVAEALRGRGNVLVAGGTGSGKTTLLNALIQLFPDEDRILVVEDTIELRVSQRNCVRLEARDLGSYQLTARDMVKHALRHRPDHIVIGEIRGEEAQDVLQALNTGHGGSLTTIHANNAVDALVRLASCAAQAGDALPWDIVCKSVGMAFSYVVHQERLPGGGRGVTELIRVGDYDRKTGGWETESVWRRPQAGRRVRTPLPPRAARLDPARGPVAVPVGGEPTSVDIHDPATVPPPARHGEPSPIVMNRWPRRKVHRLSQVPENTGVVPAEPPVRVVLPGDGLAVSGPAGDKGAGGGRASGPAGEQADA